MWEVSDRYPDPRVQAFSPRFSKYQLFHAAVERLYTGTRWGEGPVWFGDGRYLLWSDIPNDRILKWEEETGAVSVYRSPANHSNGHARDRYGRLVSCEHGARRVTRTEYDGTITVIADRYNGDRLNSPNDVVVKSDGSVWFTDPPFGLERIYEGGSGARGQAERVYRVDSAGVIEVAADDVAGPNGLCFSPDESLLYIVASRAQPTRRIRVYDVREGKLFNGRDLIDAGSGTPDGLRCDVDGNLWCGWGMGSPDLDGVRVFTPEGEPLSHIHLPERCANLCFGGANGNRLFMAAGKSLYALYVNTVGCLF